jgi:predicted dehydrogenase
MAVYGIVDPPMPMMGVSIFGNKASIRCEYTDFEGGHVKVVFDKLAGAPTLQADYKPITEGSYGHAVRAYMSEFEACLIHDKSPSPDAVEGAKTIAVGAACWASIKSGRPAKVKNVW